MIEAYLDESGTDERSPVVCVGAYAAERDEWKLFDKEWTGKLKKAGIEYFHAKDPSCDVLREPLWRCLKKRNVQGMLVSVGNKNFKQLLSHSARSTTGNAYAACALVCALAIGDWAKKENLGSVAYIIEDRSAKCRICT